MHKTELLATRLRWARQSAWSAQHPKRYRVPLSSRFIPRLAGKSWEQIARDCLAPKVGEMPLRAERANTIAVSGR